MIPRMRVEVVLIYLIFLYITPIVIKRWWVVTRQNKEIHTMSNVANNTTSDDKLVLEEGLNNDNLFVKDIKLKVFQGDNPWNRVKRSTFDYLQAFLFTISGIILVKFLLCIILIFFAYIFSLFATIGRKRKTVEIHYHNPEKCGIMVFGFVLEQFVSFLGFTGSI